MKSSSLCAFERLCEIRMCYVMCFGVIWHWYNSDCASGKATCVNLKRLIWFVSSESIFGYKDLRIDVYCTAARMLTYVGVRYSEKITPHKAEGVAVSCLHI